jgi:hypothetical protein
MDSSGHVKVPLLANPQPKISEMKLNGRDLDPLLFDVDPLAEKTDGHNVRILQIILTFLMQRENLLSY